MRFLSLLVLIGTSLGLRFQWDEDWCLTVLEGPRNRSPLRLETCADSSNQSFSFDSGHLIWSVDRRFCVDVLSGCPSNGNQVQLWDCQAAPDANHIFSLSETSVRWKGPPEKCLEITNPEEPHFSYVQIWDCDDGRRGQRLIKTD